MLQANEPSHRIESETVSTRENLFAHKSFPGLINI